jgi:hypothetical protein
LQYILQDSEKSVCPGKIPAEKAAVYRWTSRKPVRMQIISRNFHAVSGIFRDSRKSIAFSMQRVYDETKLNGR